MKERLACFIESNLKNVDEREIEAILKIFHLEDFKKGAIVKNANKQCTKLGFLISGSVRHVILKNNGDELTGRITQRDNFVTDLISIRTKEKTPISIIALEPTSMLVASTEDARELLEVNLTFHRLVREYMGDRMVEVCILLMLFMTGTAKDRYQFMLKNHPDLSRNIPLRFIASKMLDLLVKL